MRLRTSELKKTKQTIIILIRVEKIKSENIAKTLTNTIYVLYIKVILFYIFLNSSNSNDENEFQYQKKKTRKYFLEPNTVKATNDD